MISETVIIVLVSAILLETSVILYKSLKGERKKSNTDIFVDTSVLMDGRIISIAETGFVPGRLVVPRSVIGELQLLADTGDSDKREKARHGLDVLKQLQGMDTVEVTILQDDSHAREGVDERLLAHAKAYGGSLATIDFNLNKVAAVEGIKVLNINELARTLRMSYLPGERLTLDLTTTGTDTHQAVGHLGDGTMVVVEHAKSMIGKTVEVEIIRSLQTAAGRMMFARLSDQERANKQSKAHNSIERKKALDNSRKQEVERTSKYHQSLNKLPRNAKAHGQKHQTASEKHESRLIDLVEKQS